MAGFRYEVTHIGATLEIGSLLGLESAKEPSLFLQQTNSLPSLESFWVQNLRSTKEAHSSLFKKPYKKCAFGFLYILEEVDLKL